MDCVKSMNKIQTWKANAICSHVGMLLLLSVATCIPGAAGSGPARHFQLRGRRLLDVIRISSPPPNDHAVPVLSPPPSFPPPLPNPSPPPPSPPLFLAPASPPPPTYLPPVFPPPPVMASTPVLPPPPMSPPPPPPMILPAPSLPPPPTADPPSSPPLEIPVPSQAPPVESPPSPPPSTIVSPGSSTWNNSEKAGVAIAAIAALLQVAVVAFLLIKRHQMLTTVDYEDFDEESREDRTGDTDLQFDFPLNRFDPFVE